MPVKYVIQKMKGAFYAGSEKIAEHGLKMRRYLSLGRVAQMVKSLHLSASSLVFKGVSKGEQMKILGAKKASKGAKKSRKAAKKKSRKR
ncbi:Uncharacterised protein [uncultured archaeon]|nr:Uncharacterised protein [uncultured archaeon]